MIDTIVQLSAGDRLTIVHAMIERYNAQDADAYVDLMSADACEANYRGAVLREGREGVRSGLKAMFAQFPQNRAEVIQSFVLGETAMLYERVYRSADTEPFDVMSIYTFDGDKVSRVEFIR